MHIVHKLVCNTCKLTNSSIIRYQTALLNTGRERLIRTRLIRSFFEILARILSFHV